MSYASYIRSALLAVAVAATAVTSMAPSAEARYRRHHGGGFAFGIGSLIVGGILASQYRRHRYYDDSYYYRPSYSYYSAGPRFYGWSGHRRHHHRHWR